MNINDNSKNTTADQDYDNRMGVAKNEAQELLSKLKKQESEKKQAPQTAQEVGKEDQGNQGQEGGNSR